MRPFDEQVVAALAMDEGAIVEMQTGEGKTLAAVMPAALNALAGRGVHVLTFNDYLARRDAEWMAPVYQGLGLSVAFVQQGMARADRQQAYRADVTYVTAKEAGFDYLRDRLVRDVAELVHRPFHMALVDEADSILIDEARVPLVIAGAVSRSQPTSQRIAELTAGAHARRALRHRRIRPRRGAHRGGHRPTSSGRSAAATCTTSRTSRCSPTSIARCTRGCCCGATSTTWCATAGSA